MSISRLSRIWLPLFKSSLRSGSNPISNYTAYAQLFKTPCIDDAEKAQWEIDTFNIFIKNGELKPKFSGTDDKGVPFRYPDQSKISDAELDHIEKRLEFTLNPVLKARYSHILWGSNRKHAKYAKTAIDAYLELVKIYEKKDKIEEQAHYGLDVLDSIIEASLLGFKIKYKVDEIRSEIDRLVKKFDFDSSCSFVMRSRLIKHMLDNSTNFPNVCFGGFPEVCCHLAEKLFKEGNYHNAIDIYKIGKKVDNKLGKETHNWNKSIAESYEGLMNEREVSDPAAVSFCQNASEYYRKIGDKNKTQELEKKYDCLKGKQHFGTFSTEINLTEHVNHCRSIAQKLCSDDPEKIIAILIFNKDVLPRLKDMEKNAQESSKSMVLQNIVPSVIVDQHGHTAEHFSTEDEKRYYGILQQYSYSMQLEKQILIDQIFLEAVKCNKINLDLIMCHFEKHSWYGKNITKRFPGGNVTYNWLNLIAPSLNDYFMKMYTFFSQPEYRPDFILAMDSLCLKIEGLVRDICAFSGITTFYQAKDNNGRNVVRERDINWLLREEAIKSKFDEDDLLFFKFILVEKAGLNLRHKIAHCLMDYSEYNLSCMHLLILILLKLGKYDFVKSEEMVAEIVAVE